MGDNNLELANMIYKAATDLILNKKIRKGGYETYKNHFTSKVVAKKIFNELGILSKKN